MEQISYFICRYRLDDTDGYLIWYSNGSDGILCDADGSVACFSSPAELFRYAELREIEIELEDPVLHNLDAVAAWMRRDDAAGPDCNQLLRAWNLFTDLSASVHGDFDGDYGRTNIVYEKLFECAGAPDTRVQWNGEELRVLRDTLGSGLDLFRRYVRENPVIGF